MYHESIAAQAQQRAAQALLAKILMNVNKPPLNPDPSNPIVIHPPDVGGVVPNPTTPNTGLPTEEDKEDAKRYKRLVNLTYRHVVKMHRERKALEAYYNWLSNNINGVGQEAVTEAARLGLRGNTPGLFKKELSDNLKLLTEPKETNRKLGF